MKELVVLAGALSLGSWGEVAAQERDGKGASETSQLRIGEEGVVWYATWESALAEARRSQRAIFFMAAACQRGTASGVF